MSGGDDASCAYVFEPGEWEANNPTSSQLGESDLNDGRWHCPHAAVEGGEYCLFHLPPGEKDDDEVAARLLERVESGGERPKQFVGARFGDLELEHAIVESTDNHPVDLRHARVAGRLDWRYAIVRQPVEFDGATFEGDARFGDVVFEGDAFFSGARFGPGAKAYFVDATFGQASIFYDATFAGDTSFFGASFGGRTDFVQTRIERGNFREAAFGSRARFKEACFGHAEFHAATFREGAEFEAATLPASAGFRYTTFEGAVRFRNPRTGGETCRVDLRRSEVPAGTLAQPADGAVVYDLEGATVGDLEPGERDGDDWFDRLRVLNTTFEGFDFGAYRDRLVASGWRIHRLAADDGEADLTPTSGQLENTYLKAKNGANEIGDAQAAAEFFRKEMIYRRHQHVTQLREGESIRDRAVAAWRWAGNALLDVTSGYGERPSRVVVCSAAVVLVFAGAFRLVWPVEPYGGGLGYLLLSLESFITLVHGGGTTVEDRLVRLLAEAEGFVGAFLIALFVFTLTRSIHR